MKLQDFGNSHNGYILEYVTNDESIVLGSLVHFSTKMSFRQGLMGFFVGLSTSSSIAYVYLLQDYKEITEILNAHKPNQILLNTMSTRISKLQEDFDYRIKEMKRETGTRNDLKELKMGLKKEIVGF